MYVCDQTGNTGRTLKTFWRVVHGKQNRLIKQTEMEVTISTVINQMRAEGKQSAETQQGSSQNSLAKAMPPALARLRKKHPTISEFLVAYSPNRQTEICHTPEACYFGDSPTLAMLNTCYGRRAAEAWLVPEIIDACLFCGLKEQPDTYQLEKLAGIIVVNFGYLSVDELLLFFFYFCSARYRHFYNTFDPSIIILSLRDFLRDRNRSFEEREQREREREREEWKKNAITREEYLRRKESGTL